MFKVGTKFKIMQRKGKVVHQYGPEWVIKEIKRNVVYSKGSNGGTDVCSLGFFKEMVNGWVRIMTNSGLVYRKVIL